VSLPGTYDVRASFAGAGGYAPSFVAQPFTITKQKTILKVNPAAQYSDVVISLTDAAGKPLPQKTIFLTVSGPGGTSNSTVITDFAGQVRLSYPFVAGAYTFIASFGGTFAGVTSLDDVRYESSTATTTVNLAAEDATVTYTGDTLITVGTAPRLAATVAQANDGSPGDITLAQVQYTVKNATTVLGTFTAPVAADGTSSTTIPTTTLNLPVGVYQIDVTLIGGYFTGSTSALLAVYEPSGGGLVTGGGWLTSPAGAYKADPAATGRANFGFVTQLKSGARTPTGQTEFQFKAGNLNFHSTGYDSLTMSGASAQYKGKGTINGTGAYSFLVTALDGQATGGGGTDKLRIKIWDTKSGSVVYDNQVSGSTSDSATPTTPIGGGNIVVKQ
jgi:hypothetical protein